MKQTCVTFTIASRVKHVNLMFHNFEKKNTYTTIAKITTPSQSSSGRATLSMVEKIIHGDVNS